MFLGFLFQLDETHSVELLEKSINFFQVCCLIHFLHVVSTQIVYLHCFQHFLMLTWLSGIYEIGHCFAMNEHIHIISSTDGWSHQLHLNTIQFLISGIGFTSKNLSSYPQLIILEHIVANRNFKQSHHLSESFLES